MPKQLYIPLPCAAARRQLVDRQVGPGGPVRAALSEADVQKVVEKTAGYSGSDMKSVIQEACQGPVREAVMQHGALGACPLQTRRKCSRAIDKRMVDQSCRLVRLLRRLLGPCTLRPVGLRGSRAGARHSNAHRSPCVQ
jgi:SpoVK/Ycf46/Vps4 family AAA+-type ATPase